MVKFLLTILFALTVCQPVSKAQGAPDFAGRWDGAIELPGSPLGISVDLERDESWRGTIDIPAQNITGAPLGELRVEGQSVTFVIADISGEPTFDGTLSGDTIQGTFSQSGESSPFTLTRFVELSGAERAVALEQGRTLTELFDDKKFSELYARFSDQMRAAIGQAQLQEFQQQVGQETVEQKQDETVSRTGNLLIYTRTTELGKLGPAIVEWTFDAQGLVEGFYIRPAQGAEDSEAPSERLEYRTKTALRLPFGGAWYVFWGGRTVAENYHAAVSDQRFASDFLVMKDGSSYRGDGAQLEDYYCFGRPIHAPGAGTVIETMSNLPDLPIGQSDTENALGNHVIIDHGNGEFSFLAHLKQGSVNAKPGDEVLAGARLGLCGNSGNTSEPHLHYHLQTDAVFYGGAGGEGLPAQFLNYTANGEPVARGEPVKGQTVAR